MTEYDAEPGTPDDESEAVEAEPTLNDELAQLPPKVVELIADMYSELGELRQAVAEQAGEQDASEFAEPEVTTLPEGTARFFNDTYSEELVIRIPARNMFIDGNQVFQPMLACEFQNHVYTTSDPEMIDFLENHELYGVRIFRDDNALPQRHMPGLSTGVRDSTSSPRSNPLAAPMG